MPTPLSLSQQSLANVPDAVVARAYRLRPGYSVSNLRRALDLVVGRHQAPRMRLCRDSSGALAQEFRPAGEPTTLELADPTDPAKAERLALDFCARPVDLFSDAALGALIIPLVDGSAMLVVRIHHLATDGWGFDRFVDELRIAYQAFGLDCPPALPDLRTSFVDHIAAEVAKGDSLTPEQRDYWATTLVGARPFAFPRSDPSPPRSIMASQAKSSLNELDEVGAKGVLELARSVRVPTAAAVLAALTVALSAQFDEDDLILRCTYLGRNDPATMRMVACFTRTAFVRLRLTEHRNLQELLSAAARTWVAGARNSAPPFTVGRLARDLVRTGAVKRDEAASLLGNVRQCVTLNYFNEVKMAETGDGSPFSDDLAPLPLRPISGVDADARVMPLVVEARASDRISVACLYNQDSYRGSSIAELSLLMSVALREMTPDSVEVATTDFVAKVAAHAHDGNTALDASPRV